MTRDGEGESKKKPAATKPVVDPKLVVQGTRGVDPELIVNLTAAEKLEKSATRLVEQSPEQGDEKGKAD